MATTNTNDTTETIKQAEPSTIKPARTKKKLLMTVLIALLIVLPALGIWYWQASAANTQRVKLQKQIDDLKKVNDELKSKAKKPSTAAVVPVKPICTTGLTTAQTENVHAAVQTANTAALDGIMTDMVEYVAAASGKVGSESKVAANNDLASFLVGASGTWNWNISALTLSSYKAGSYSTYLADDTIFGTSADKHFVSMRVTCGKIDQVFVSASTDLLP